MYSVIMMTVLLTASAASGNGPAEYDGVYAPPSSYAYFAGYADFAPYSGYGGYSGYAGYAPYSGYANYSGYSGYAPYSGFANYSGFAEFAPYSSHAYYPCQGCGPVLGVYPIILK